MILEFMINRQLENILERKMYKSSSFFIPLFAGSKTSTSKFGKMGDQLPLKARLVKANNQWGIKPPPLIKVSLYVR
ncbi:hypothetical protein BAGA_15340 [Bacillus gaemokensis]|uniref:Uncharacterized protein n=1 Tax=Bacillus gaemokensis TaxID=574375 RepID=A0A073K8P7_9BACI|nr:hypothetical protein BAGA_15340 [Bacillus gaemokensis]KYG34701.1 hypothetical protein AZF08_09955 [Bacillus gaemokensis]